MQLPLYTKTGAALIRLDTNEWQTILEINSDVGHRFTVLVVDAASVACGVSADYSPQALDSKYPAKPDTARLAEVVKSAFDGYAPRLRSQALALRIEDGQLLGEYNGSSYCLMDISLHPSSSLDALMVILNENGQAAYIPDERSNGVGRQPIYARNAKAVYHTVEAIRQAAPFLACALASLPNPENLQE